MAAESRRTDSPLAKVLFDQAYSFDFFQAVRLLERIHPERRAVGRNSEPARETVRFRTHASLSFPPSQVHQITADTTADGSRPPQMTVEFMGLTGPLGVLPYFYTELLVERARYKDTALWDFLDLFNHRMIAFFYRAWEKHRFPIAYERGEDDRFSEYLFDIIGMGTRGLRDRLSFPDQGLLFYGGLVAQQPHSASAIEATLSDYFRVPVRAAQFFGQWLKLDEESVSRLGTANSHLGRDTIAGARVWDDQFKFRVKVGPLTLSEFMAFLPVGSAFRPAAELTRLLAGPEFDFDVQVVLRAAEVPGCVLGGPCGSPAGRLPRLGWTTWLKTREFTEDDSQVVLRENQRTAETPKA